MLNGIGTPPMAGNYRIINYKLQILAVLLLSFFFITPNVALAISTIDFSGAKNLFHELKVGDKVDGDLSTGFPNPYEGAGFLVGYKIVIPDNTDPGKVTLNVQTCGIRFAFICVGSSFDEKIYVYDDKLKPIGDNFTFHDSVDLSKINVPQTKTLYLLVGSSSASETGQFVVSANLKETAK